MPNAPGQGLVGWSTPDAVRAPLCYLACGVLFAAKGELDWMGHMHALLVAGYVAVVAALTLLMRWVVGEPE
jgi:hypothetical protein